MKNCIFYLPYKIDEIAMGARMMRPRKMIQAFRDIGYNVEVISGTSNERRPLIRKIKKKIRAGIQYQFMYTEAHTEPTLLTNPNHLPTHPFLDYGFFRFIKKHQIRIGLFYPDIYWKFDIYGADLPGWKKKSALLCYKYDIKQYKKYLDRFYVADLHVCDILRETQLTSIAEELLPGAENLQIEQNDEVGERDFKLRPLTIFYVGGLGGNYQITELAKAVYQMNNIKFILCCRKAEWDREKEKFDPYLCDRIDVVHKSGEELETFYKSADLCSLLFRRGEYIDMAKPFKTFEYLAHEKPIISTKGTSIGRYVEKNDLGWTVDFAADKIKNLLKMILDEPNQLESKKRKCKIAKECNLWVCRAQQVERSLVKDNR